MLGNISSIIENTIIIKLEVDLKKINNIINMLSFKMRTII